MVWAGEGEDIWRRGETGTLGWLIAEHGEMKIKKANITKIPAQIVAILLAFKKSCGNKRIFCLLRVKGHSSVLSFFFCREEDEMIGTRGRGPPLYSCRTRSINMFM